MKKSKSENPEKWEWYCEPCHNHFVTSAKARVKIGPDQLGWVEIDVCPKCGNRDIRKVARK